MLQIEVDPHRRDPLRRHLARIRIDDMLSGELDDTEVTLLIHSPSKTFMDPNPVGYRFLVALALPIDDPHTGPLEIEPQASTDRTVAGCGHPMPPTPLPAKRRNVPAPCTSAGTITPFREIQSGEFRFDNSQSKVEAQSSISNVRRTGWFATMTAAGSKADLSVTSRPHVTGS